MLESLMIWSLFVPTQIDPIEEVPVQSVVISLIDDVDLALGEAGIVRVVQFQPGEIVKKGDLLATLDTTDARLDLEKVDAELAMSKLKASNDLTIQLSQKALAVAKTEYQRAIRANEKFSATVSASEIDRLKLRLDEAELQIEQAKRDRDYLQLEVKLKEVERTMMQRRLERRELRSPIDGMIVKLHLQAGEWAHPDQPLFRIINMDRVRVEGFVSTSQRTVNVGDKVTVVPRPEDSPEGLQPVSGRVTFVDPEIDTITNQYKIWAEVSNSKLKLRPGHRPAMMVHKAELSKQKVGGENPTVQ